MWERPRVTESDHSVGIRVWARASDPVDSWDDFSSASKVYGASLRRSVRGRVDQVSRRQERSESQGKWPKSSEKPKASEPGAGSLLGCGSVRVRPRRADARDLRQVWRGAGAARGGRERQAARSLSRWLDDSECRWALPVWREAGAGAVGIRLDGPPNLRPRAGRQGAGSGGEGRRRGGSEALWAQHPEREALPSAVGWRRAAGRSCHQKDSRVRRACERLGRRSRELHVPCHPQARSTCRTSWPQADPRRSGRREDCGRARHHPESDGRR
jgi:hypothetical protein